MLYIFFFLLLGRVFPLANNAVCVVYEEQASTPSPPLLPPSGLACQEQIKRFAFALGHAVARLTVVGVRFYNNAAVSTRDQRANLFLKDLSPNVCLWNIVIYNYIFFVEQYIRSVSLIFQLEIILAIRVCFRNSFTYLSKKIWNRFILQSNKTLG